MAAEKNTNRSVVSETDKVCALCGHDLRAAAGFCGECGAVVEEVGGAEDKIVYSNVLPLTRLKVVVSNINNIVTPRKIIPNWKEIVTPLASMCVGTLISTILFVFSFTEKNYIILLICVPVLVISFIYPLYRFVRQGIVYKYGFALIGKVIYCFDDVSINRKPYYRLVVEYNYNGTLYKSNLSMMKKTELGQIVLIVLQKHPNLLDAYQGSDLWKITDFKH